MIYHAAIKAKYPNAKYELRDNGEGVYFHSWEDESPMPDIKDFQSGAIMIAREYEEALKAIKYLESTDWIMLRALEEKDKGMPNDIRQHRSNARVIISNARKSGLII